MMERLLEPFYNWLKKYPVLAGIVTVVIIVFIALSSIFDLLDKMEQRIYSPIAREVVCIGKDTVKNENTGNVTQIGIEVGGNNEVRTVRGEHGNTLRKNSGNVTQEKIKVEGNNIVIAGDTI